MAEKLSKGLFVTFEGPEGSGKSTHSKFLYEELVSCGFEVVYTAEPGGTSLGSKIRNILLEKNEIQLSAISELFLFEADRAQHLEEVINPSLAEGKIVLCDRFNTATFAYQGYGLGMDMETIETVDLKATGGIVPDLVILMDIDVKIGLNRANENSGPDRMEKREKDFHERVRSGYLALAEKSPGRIKVIKVKETIEDTYKLIKEEVDDLIERNKRTE